MTKLRYKIKVKENKKMKITNVKYEKNYIKGHCKTCDYGARYINYFTLYYDNGEKDEIRIDNTYDYVVSEWDLIQLVVHFVDREKLVDKLKEMTDKAGAKLYINGNEIL